MSIKSEIVNREFKEGRRLKEAARKSTQNLEDYIQAAEHLYNASTLSLEISKDNGNSLEERAQTEALAFYYSYERHYCLGTFFYEKRQIPQAISHFDQGLQDLKMGISLIENISSTVDKEIANHLRSLLPKWRYFLKMEESVIHAANGRSAWDRDLLVDALDSYRKAAQIQKDAIQMAETFEPPYYRITVGNYIGMMANESRALAGIILKKGTMEEKVDSSKLISTDSAIDLLRYTLHAYLLSKSAFDNNPEWDQYREGAENCIDNIRNFLNDNPASWLKIYLSFEHQPEFLTIMKTTNLDRFKEVEDQRFNKSKPLILWKVGGFMLFMLIVISAIVYLLFTSLSNFWWLLLALVTIEVLFLLVGGMILRTIGDLSEQGFLKLVALALKHQFKFNWSSIKKDV